MARTKSQKLRDDIIATMEELLDKVEQEIVSGIEDGMYEEEENEEPLKRIAQSRRLLDKFKKDIPSIYIFVEGGNIQGISNNQPMSINIFDKDNYEAALSDKDAGPYPYTLGEWDEMISKRTKAGELRPAY